MSNKGNQAIPLVIGVVGGSGELASLSPVFDEFRNTFGSSTPIKVIQAELTGEVHFFDASSPQAYSRLSVSQSGASKHPQDVATYLLRNCHFVLLAATLDKTHPLRCAIEEFAVEFPAEIPTVDGDNISVFELPEPAPVLDQIEANSLKLEILKREINSHSSKHAEAGGASHKQTNFSLALFQYAEASPAWKFWLGLVQEPPSVYVSSCGEKPFSFVRNAKDAMGRRWLDCVKAIHRQVAFNDEVWTDSEISSYQVERFGFTALDKVPHDPKVCDLKDLLLIQCKADTLASNYQTLWQKIRFATMKDLAARLIQWGKKESDQSAARMTRSGRLIQWSKNKDGGWKLAIGSRELNIKNCGYPRRFFSFLWLGGISAFFFVFSTEFGGLLGGWSNILASLGYALILLFTFVLYIDVRKQSWEQKHQDYRFIAEVLAIQLHWMSGGIKKYASDHFPSGIKSDVQWVRRAVHTSRFLSKVAEGESTLPIDEVCKSWVASQSNWHKEKFQEGREKALDALNKRRGFAGKMFIGLFLIFTVFTVYEGSSMLGGGHAGGHKQKVHVVVGHEEPNQQNVVSHDTVVEPVDNVAHAEEGATAHEGGDMSQSDHEDEHHAELWKERLEQFHHLLIVLMVTSLVLFALLGEAIEGYGIEQELTRSEALVGVYNRCLREFKKHSDDGKKRKLLMDVGGFAIEAEANWLVVHRERPMQPVKGG